VWTEYTAVALNLVYILVHGAIQQEEYKVFNHHIMEVYMGSGGKATRILNLSTRLRLFTKFTFGSGERALGIC
jgi:hypothetical protein